VCHGRETLSVTCAWASLRLLFSLQVLLVLTVTLQVQVITCKKDKMENDAVRTCQPEVLIIHSQRTLYFCSTSWCTGNCASLSNTGLCARCKTIYDIRKGFAGDGRRLDSHQPQLRAGPAPASGSKALKQAQLSSSKSHSPLQRGFAGADASVPQARRRAYLRPSPIGSAS
jgi:hypothetical protein